MKALVHVCEGAECGERLKTGEGFVIEGVAITLFHESALESLAEPPRPRGKSDGKTELCGACFAKVLGMNDHEVAEKVLNLIRDEYQRLLALSRVNVGRWGKE